MFFLDEEKITEVNMARKCMGNMNMINEFFGFYILDFSSYEILTIILVKGQKQKYVQSVKSIQQYSSFFGKESSIS